MLPALRKKSQGLRYYVAAAMREPLQRRAEQLGLADTVHFLGRLSNDDYVTALQAADILVHPNYTTDRGD